AQGAPHNRPPNLEKGVPLRRRYGVPFARRLTRQFAAWLGLTPQQHSTGGKTRLGGISKQGDRYLRRLLVVGATAVMRHIKDKPTPMADWIRKLSEKKPFRLVSVALANKLARIAWVVLTRKEAYHPYAHLT
ncbi:transposase, partial [Sphingobium olei]